MIGWLIYDADNIKRNQFFIDRWIGAAKAEAITLKVVTAQEISYGFCSGKAFINQGLTEEKIDFAVMRAQHPLLSTHLEAMGIPCFNDARTADICNDKQKTYSMFADALPMVDTAFLEQNAFISPFAYPVVVKSAHGCGGRGVYLAKDDSEFRQAISKIYPDRIVVQKLCDEPGKDLRVYVLGKNIIAGMLRYSPTDFRSNVGLGGG
ncbi:MAG: ATP-grasp domain-containing protein, partial [Clostridiales bacterium]|nr:ATP-grasp domain-containing protein [Clostridiales bacterium]